MKITKQNAIAQVQSSVSSIFSKEDVLFLLNAIDLELGSSKRISAEDIERAIDKTISWIENNDRDVVDYDSAEFQISYNNRLELDSIAINTTDIREALENNFSDFARQDEDEQDLSTFGSSEESEMN